MRPGAFSDDLPAGSVRAHVPADPARLGKYHLQDTAVTLTLMEWLNGNDEDHSCWYDFMETPPVWKTRWFWIAVAASGLLVLLFLLTVMR
jgi:hypothetical protein